MKVIIVGCGRVGVELALSVHREHQVTIIDRDVRSFDRLGPHFSGQTIQGEGMDRSVLLRAGIESADTLAAVTSSDNVNAIVARIAREIFHVRQVAARLYNPRRAPVYEKLNIQTVSSSSWGAERIEQLMLHPGLLNVASARDGEVKVFEITVPAEWNGRRLDELAPLEHTIPVMLERDGRGLLPRADMVLETQDILQISATTEGARILRRHVHDIENG